MKTLVALLLLSSVGLAQQPSKSKIVTFNRADAEHCKVVLEDGKPMLQTTYEGTSVAVALPEKDSHGFSVLVRVTREGKGKVEVQPEKLTALYSDPDQTRFQFFDRSREWEKSQKDALTAQKTQPGSSGITSASTQDNSKLPNSPPPNTARATMADGTTWSTNPTMKVNDGAGRWTSEGGAPLHPPMSPPNQSPYLRRTVLHQGNQVEGLVCFQKPKESKVEVTPTGALNEIDIPIGDVTFRF